jgi:phosphoserine aminotransferase
MISFYPGPSKLYPQVKQYLQEAYDSGILSVNHRSAEFVEVSRQAVTMLKKKLCVPDDYKVFFISSATEAWEIIAQSLVREKSFHLYNGAFGEKWCEYTGKLRKAAKLQFDAGEKLAAGSVSVPEDAEVICITHNETSNGTALSMEFIKSLRAENPHKLIAVDATSSMAGVVLDFKSADIWFASVQKCFGLPAGLAVMICSPEADIRAAETGDYNHYNSYLFLDEKMKDWQTTYTPNVLNIYLLGKLVSHIPEIVETDLRIVSRGKLLYDEISKISAIELLVENPAVRSDTVLAVMAEAGFIESIKKSAKAAGLLLGNGYGRWKNNTFRIANFPAIEDNELDQVINFLKKL